MRSAQPAPREPLSGIVLAGGLGTRLGSDKAAAQAAGRSLLHWTVRALAAVADEIIVVARIGQTLPPPGEHPWRIVHDARPEAGPLAGIEAGLAAARHDLTLVVATDMPLLQPALLRAVAAGCRGVDLAMPVRDGRPEPLLAAYRRACLPLVSSLLDRDERRPRRLLDEAPSRRIAVDDLRAHDATLESFRNVNTPDDLAQIARLLGATPTPALASPVRTAPALTTGTLNGDPS